MQRSITHLRRFAATCALLLLAFAPPSAAQTSQQDTREASESLALLQSMVGTWHVEQRMWPGAGKPATNLPPAIARRRLIENVFLEEVMGPSQAQVAPFTRTAYLNFNAIDQQYEYFSLDSRLPQMMFEKSVSGETPRDARTASITLYGGSFVAPQWGDARNVPFIYRLTVGPVADNQQVVRLYLLPQSGEPSKEFLAFEYLYTRLE